MNFIKKYFRGRDFDRNLFYIISFTTLPASLAGLIIGPVFDNLITTLGTGIISILYIFVVFLFYRKKKYSFGNQVLVGLTGFGLFTVIYLTTYGINSAFPLYMLLIPATYGVITIKKRDYILPALNLILYELLLAYSFFSKDLYEIRIVPYLIGFMFSYGLIFAITSYLSISTRRLTRKLFEASTIDELTKVYNRRFFDDNFNSYDYQIAAMFDIDDFKQVNDIYGHQAGDTVLYNFAQLLLRFCSDEFRCYRWGGEEFVILSKLDIETTTVQIKKIMDTVRKDFKDPEQNPITVSCGLAATKKSLLMKTVDENLYVAKNSGKNMMVFQDSKIY